MRELVAEILASLVASVVLAVMVAAGGAALARTPSTVETPEVNPIDHMTICPDDGEPGYCFRAET